MSPLAEITPEKLAQMLANRVCLCPNARVIPDPQEWTPTLVEVNWAVALQTNLPTEKSDAFHPLHQTLPSMLVANAAELVYTGIEMHDALQLDGKELEDFIENFNEALTDELNQHHPHVTVPDINTLKAFLQILQSRSHPKQNLAAITSATQLGEVCQIPLTVEVPELAYASLTEGLVKLNIVFDQAELGQLFEELTTHKYIPGEFLGSAFIS